MMHGRRGGAHAVSARIGSVPGVRTIELEGPRGIRLLADVPSSRRERMRGLRRRPSLDAGQALLLRRCRGVHSVGMRFPVTIVGLDARLGVRWVRALPPRRLARAPRSVRHLLEVSPELAVRPGDRFREVGARRRVA
jgi:hypothetical protein